MIFLITFMTPSLLPVINLLPELSKEKAVTSKSFI